MVLVLLVIVALGVGGLTAASGQRLTVTTPEEELVFSLSTDRETVLVGNDGLALTVVIENGSAFVRTADCPDQVCVHTGRLSHSGDTAVCVPAGIVLRVEGGDAASPDAVAQ